jgi:hypothetical protein
VFFARRSLLRDIFWAFLGNIEKRGHKLANERSLIDVGYRLVAEYQIELAGADDIRSDEIDRYDALVVTGEQDSGREGLQLALRR